MNSASELDAELGMDSFASKSLPCEARARASEEDFRVEEVVSLNLITGEPRPGYFPVYRVEKRGTDTMHMERELSRVLGSRVSYGGMKDKRAATVQYVTLTSARSAKAMKVSRPGFEAEFVGYLPFPISRGSVLGNRFAVTLRECCPSIADSVAEAYGLAEEGRIPNYFGYQRFGVMGAGTHMIGRAIVRRRFDEAVELMLSAPVDGTSDAVRVADSVSDVLEPGGHGRLPPGKDLERIVASRLEEKPEEYVGALRGLPINVRRLYVQAYQSYLFNKAISFAMSEGLDISAPKPGDNWSELRPEGSVAPTVGSVKEPPPSGAVPMVQLVGYAYRNYGSRFDAMTARAMEEEQVVPRDFYVKEMQEVSAEGGFRVSHLVVREQSFRTSGSNAFLEFRLVRGQYATVLLREVMKPGNPRESGLA